MARRILAQLRRLHPCHFVCSPGGRNAPFSFALGHRPENESTVILDERTAGFFALGRARNSPQRLVVLLCTSGSAGAHYLPALIEADYSGVPLFVITSDRPNHLRHTGSAQTIEQRNFFGHHVLASKHIDANDTSAKDVCMAVANLVNHAVSQQGPVHLNVGFDEPLHSSTEHPSVDDVWVGVTEPVRTHPEIEHIVHHLNGAERGLIIWGPNACTDATDQEAAEQLMARLPWTAFAHGTSNIRGGSSSTLLPIALDHGITTGYLTDSPPDCILYVGQAPTSRVVLEYLSSMDTIPIISISKGRHIVQPWKHGYAYSEQSPQMLTAITERLRQRPKPDLRRMRILNQKIRDVFRQDDDRSRWAGSTIRSIVQSLPHNAQLQVGNSLIIRDLDLYCESTQPSISVFANRGVNGIDGQIATAAGMASAAPNRPSFLLCGDLTALHDSASFVLAKQYGVAILVIDNDGGAIFDHLPFAEQSDAFERFFTTPQPVLLEDIVIGFGMTVKKISADQDSVGLCDDALAGGTVYLFKVDAKVGKRNRRAITDTVRMIKC